MSFGGQAVAFVTVSRGEPGYLGLGGTSRADDTVFGCHFRPASSVETPANSESDVATEIWKLTAPPTSTVLAAGPGDELSYDGNTYQILGPIMPKYDDDGTVHHVTIMAKRQR